MKRIITTGDFIIYRGDERATVIHSRYTKVRGLNTHYVEAGIEKGKTILMLPGWPQSWRSFILLIHELSTKYHIIALDLPGIGGLSEKLHKKYSCKFYPAFVHAFVKKLKLDRFYLLGVSFGGLISLLYGRQHPERVEKIVVNSPPYNGIAVRKHGAFRWNLRMLEKGFFDKRWSHAFLKLLKFARFHITPTRFVDDHGKGIDKELVHFCLSDAKKTDEEAAVDIAKELFYIDYSKELMSMKVPTLSITGSKDHTVPVKCSRKLGKEILPRGRFISIKGYNHYMIAQNPKLFCKRVVEFLEN